MTFLAPAWLFALFPWGAWAAWLLVGRRARQWVPFLALWEAPEELRRPKKGFEPPPKGLVFALLAALLGLLAVARPRIREPFVRDGERVFTIIVDRGASMSANGPTGQPRFHEAVVGVVDALEQRREPIRLHFADVLHQSDQMAFSTAVPEVLSRFNATAIDTGGQIAPLVSYFAGRGPTLVVTDQDFGPLADRVIQVSPTAPVRNVGITAMAYRPGQLMVTLRATLAAATRTVRVRSGDIELRKSVEIKPGPPQVVFIDVPGGVADAIEASLEGGGDDFTADDTAWLVRRRAWPVVEARASLSDELRRMLEVYSKHRPPGDASTRIALARAGELKSDEPGVVLGRTEAGDPIPASDVRASPHPVVTGVDWSVLVQGMSRPSQPPGEGWQTVVTSGGKPILAVRGAEAARQVWVGFDSAHFARTPAFVVFWTNVFDWVGGGGGDDFSASSVAAIPTKAKRLTPQPLPPRVDSARWPGVFETVTGKLAANAGAVTFRSVQTDWRARLDAIPVTGGSGVELTRWFALVALACVVLAAATWERKRVATAIAPPAHLDVESVTRVQTTFAADGRVHRHESTTRP